MRQIKFRVWDTEDKHFATLPNVGLSLEDIINAHAEKGKKLPKTAIFQQFVGLTDKNGREIYEGDIVKYCHWNDCDTNGDRKWRVGEIIWDVMEYRFCLRPYQAMNSLYSSKMYEIIGNIYETTELLHE